MSKRNPTMVIGRIKNEGNRVLLYGQKPFSHYYVVAITKQAKPLHIGDMIRYEPSDMNSGWFVSKVEPTD